MKRTTLFLAGTALAAGLNAQVVTNELWTATAAPVLTLSEVDEIQNPTYVAENGDAFVSGRFTDPFTFNGQEYEAIATSAFLKKYSVTGAEEWAITMQGSAKITQITEGADGTIYVAGMLADEVVFTSTDGSTLTDKGYVNTAGEPVASFDASFIAAYNQDGKLLYEKVYKAEVTSYYPTDAAGDVTFTVTKIQENAGNLYVAAIVKGNFSQNGVTLPGSSYEADFFPGLFLGNQPQAAIFQLSDDLNVQNITASLTEKTPTVMQQYSVADIDFTIDEGTLRMALITAGTKNLFIAGQTVPVDFGLVDGDLVYGHIITSNQLGSSEYQAETFSAVDGIFPKTNIKDMQVNEGKLFVAGVFSSNLAFDNALEAVGGSDLFVTQFDASTLAPQSSYASMYNEGDKNYFAETCQGIAFAGESVIVKGFSFQDQNNIETPLKGIVLELDTKVGTATFSEASALTAGLSSNGDKVLETNVSLNEGLVQQTYILSEVEGSTGIEDVVNGAEVTVFPTRTNNVINLSQAADVAIFDLTGALVLEQANVTVVSVADLLPGNYILRVSTQAGTQVVKIIKQ